MKLCGQIKNADVPVGKSQYQLTS